MRPKLQSFAGFAATLLPHETARLLGVQQFADAEKRAILERLHYNCVHLDRPLPFDAAIDKRKYSGLKNWIAGRLRETDADVQFEWMLGLERKIATDAISPEEEREILRALRHSRPTDYFFVKFYELVQAFRHFLLIRLRHKEHRQTDKFLRDHRDAWRRAKHIYEQLHEASLDIVGQYTTGAGESSQWQQWLSEVFYDETLDGQNRYFALIRLIFVHLNYGSISRLPEKFEYQDRLFTDGVYYSRRVLLNYYSQRLLLHSKLKDYERAAYYGYLSIRGKNSDYLYYLNNLAAVLLRGKKCAEALALMKSAHAEAKNTRNWYNKIGFVAFYMRCLICNSQYRAAENYGAAFLKAWPKEIFEYRWHLFFTNYLGALFYTGKNARLLATARKYDLETRDQEYRKKSTYLPLIPWYCQLAALLETGRGLQVFAENVTSYARSLPPDAERLPQVWEFLDALKYRAPETYEFVAARLRAALHG